MMKPNIFLKAGHYSGNPGDPGAMANGYIEHAEALKIRNACIEPIHEADFGLIVVPETLTLSEAIKYVNRLAPNLNDGLGIDIHLNYSSNPKRTGVEAYYYNGVEKSKSIASIFSKHIAQFLGINDNGAMPDTSAAVGSLGWIRDLKTWSILIEVCYISNQGDMDKLDYNLCAKGIVESLKEIFTIK